MNTKNTGSALITEYLSAGGLFNPEMMEHDKVRDMLISLRADVEELEAIREYLWPNQTGLPNEFRNTLVAIKARERLSSRRIRLPRHPSTEGITEDAINSILSRLRGGEFGFRQEISTEGLCELALEALRARKQS